MTARLRSLVLVFLGVGACQSPAGSGASVTFDEFQSEAARADCRLLFECCTSSEISGVFTPGATVTTEAECVGYFEAHFRSAASLLAPHFDAGWLAWDEAAAGECIAALDAATCPDILGGVLVQPTGRTPSTVPACGATYVGLVADGAACSFDGDCISGFCPTDGPTARTCTVLPAEGAPCASRCAAGLICDSRAPDPRCLVPAPGGSACTPGSDGTCASGFCDAGTCGPRPAITLCGATR